VQVHPRNATASGPSASSCTASAFLPTSSAMGANAPIARTPKLTPASGRKQSSTSCRGIRQPSNPSSRWLRPRPHQASPSSFMLEAATASAQIVVKSIASASRQASPVLLHVGVLSV